MIRERLPPVFTPEEREQNEARKNELMKLVASGEALLFVGAGSSARVGYCTWLSLLRELEELACDCDDGFVVDENKRQNNPLRQLQYAQRIKNCIKEKTGNLNKYHNLLYKLFRPHNPPFDDFHKTLVRLPFKGILTTNYDTVLEAALGEKDPVFAHDNSLVIEEGSAKRVSEFLLSLDFKEKCSCRIAHLHGIYNRPNSLILSLDDYIRVYRLSPYKGKSESKLQDAAPSWSLHRKLLWAILATRRVVFIGFSMDDPYLKGMLDFVSGDLWRWGESVHFAVMSISPANADKTKIEFEHLQKKYGVGVVFYEDFDGSHQGLEQIIAEVDRECGGEPVSDWMDMVNQRMEERIKINEN